MTTNCYFDGACDPNPGGEIGWGWLIRHTSKGSGHMPASKINSNNVAEYAALYFLLKEIQRLVQIQAISGHILIHGDSKLVINQMDGTWKIKNGLYKPWAQKAQAVLRRLQKESDIKISFKWIRREFNVEADELSKNYVNTQIDITHLSPEWIKNTVKAMVEAEVITLEELVDYVMIYE